MTKKEFRDRITRALYASDEERRALIESLDKRGKDFVSFILNTDQFKKLPEKERLIAFFNFLIAQSVDLERRFDLADFERHFPSLERFFGTIFTYRYSFVAKREETLRALGCESEWDDDKKKRYIKSLSAYVSWNFDVDKATFESFDEYLMGLRILHVLAD